MYTCVHVRLSFLFAPSYLRDASDVGTSLKKRRTTERGWFFFLGTFTGKIYLATMLRPVRWAHLFSSLCSFSVEIGLARVDLGGARCSGQKKLGENFSTNPIALSFVRRMGHANRGIYWGTRLCKWNEALDASVLISTRYTFLVYRGLFSNELISCASKGGLQSFIR